MCREANRPLCVRHGREGLIGLQGQHRTVDSRVNTVRLSEFRGKNACGVLEHRVGMGVFAVKEPSRAALCVLQQSLEPLGRMEE